MTQVVPASPSSAHYGASSLSDACPALLHNDEHLYRLGQSLTVLHAHKGTGARLRILILKDDPVNPMVLQGDRLLRPSATLGLKAELRHQQHLQARCAAPLGADPTPVDLLVRDNQVLELQLDSLGDPPRISSATLALAAAIDSAARAPAPRAASGLGRLFRRSQDEAPLHTDQGAVTRTIQELRAAVQQLLVTPFATLTLEWDDVPDMT
ncbi:hypothetical protein [Deinococcus arcticus]|uniref:Uncharacterized protein n=1 Tax=Deinococcus arcticus TaxID=2136176 RepID=A0A2T3W9J3_9DEIO|nr:hypothetical protein [Deinococcus arcticus]PTA68464.1 hypothetical protein C8263_06575 [Deinococcus arcticus]